MSKRNIQHFLSKTAVWLCPHIRLSDPWVAGAVFGTFRPGQRYDDPIEQYRAEQEGGDDVLRCGDCKTEIKVLRQERSDNYDECHVVAVRFLGLGESAEDLDWLGQCVLEANEVVEGGDVRSKQPKREDSDECCCSLM